MSSEVSVRSAIKTLEESTGIVITSYFGSDVDPDFGLALLRDTVYMFVREVADSRRICISVDGPGPALAIARSVVEETGVQMVASEVNRGKLAGARNGVRHLLADPTLRYVAVVDQDGDHFANELLNFVRAAEHVAQGMQTGRVMVLGDRISRHRPLGFLRGEQEELADRILLDALSYDAAINNKPLRMQFANAESEFPDFHSGYKFFSRATAEDVFLSEPHLAGCSEDAYYRHSCEAVPVVEAIKQGAILATVNRRTFDEQPTSEFSKLNRAQLHADLIIWPCKRLGVPGHFVEQWLVNQMHRLRLATLLPQGREELTAIAELVLAAYGRSFPTSSEGGFSRPRFV